jgi:hypothetical protein
MVNPRKIWIFMVAYLANMNEIKLIWIFVVTYLANMNEIWGVRNGKKSSNIISNCHSAMLV